MSIKSIIILRSGALGDLVYHTAVIEALRLEFGKEVLIDYICNPNSSFLLKNDDRINNVFTLRYKKIPLLLSKEKKDIVKYSKKKHYDILINFESNKHFKSLLKSIKADTKIGAFLSDISHIYGKQINRAEMQKEILKSIVSKDNRDNAFPKVMTTNFKPLKEKFNLKKDYIVLSMTNSHIKRSAINYRAWENEKWHKLLTLLSKDEQIIIVGAKGEEFFFQDFQPYPDNVVDLVGKNSILELSTIVENAKAVVCTDSAIGHISASVNTPVFVLMGPNDTITDSPYKTPLNSVNIISKKLDCSPCYNTQVMKNCSENICMKSISEMDVYNEIKNYFT